MLFTRNKKVDVYLDDIGVQEYSIHRPELEKSAGFCKWKRNPPGNIAEMVPDAEGGLFSEALNLWSRREEQQHSRVRFLRPYLPGGTSITTDYNFYGRAPS